MRWPRPRVTILGLMALVAMLAIGFGMWVWAMRGRRAQVYRAKAEQFARAEQDHRNKAATWHSRANNDAFVIEMKRDRVQDDYDEGVLRSHRESLEFDRQMERQEDLVADYYRDLARKYRDAAGHPWESMEPDPPSPEPRPIVLRRR